MFQFRYSSCCFNLSPTSLFFVRISRFNFRLALLIFYWYPKWNIHNLFLIIQIKHCFWQIYEHVLMSCHFWKSIFQQFCTKQLSKCKNFVIHYSSFPNLNFVSVFWNFWFLLVDSFDHSNNGKGLKYDSLLVNMVSMCWLFWQG